jgi:hypothetical protein
MRMFEAFAAGQRVAKLTLQRQAKKQTVRDLQNLTELELTCHLQIVMLQPSYLVSIVTATTLSRGSCHCICIQVALNARPSLSYHTLA